MTNAIATMRTGVDRPLRGPRTPNTLLLRQLMEQQQREEMGQRIAELRERSPWSQAEIAEKLGYKNPRGYQKLEEKGTTKFEYCERLAGLHESWTQRSEDWRHVDAEWIWDGKQPEQPHGSPLDALSKMQGEASLTEVVAAVEALRLEMVTTRTQLLAEIAKVQAALEAPPSTQDKAEQR